MYERQAVTSILFWCRCFAHPNFKISAILRAVLRDEMIAWNKKNSPESQYQDQSGQPLNKDQEVLTTKPFFCFNFCKSPSSEPRKITGVGLDFLFFFFFSLGYHHHGYQSSDIDQSASRQSLDVRWDREQSKHSCRGGKLAGQPLSHGSCLASLAIESKGSSNRLQPRQSGTTFHSCLYYKASCEGM